MFHHFLSIVVYTFKLIYMYPYAFYLFINIIKNASMVYANLFFTLYCWDSCWLWHVPEVTSFWLLHISLCEFPTVDKFTHMSINWKVASRFWPLWTVTLHPPNLQHMESFSQVLKDVVSFLPRFVGILFTGCHWSRC